MKILIAEDSLPQRQWLKEILTLWGHDVTTAYDGEQAWQILSQENAPRLVILDWMMPGMNGPEICQKFRETYNSRPTHIILLTGQKKTTENLIHGLEAGADDYLTKPVDPDELQARIQSGIRVLELQSNLVTHTRELEQEIAERKRIETALRESQGRYQALFEQANDAILLENENGEIIDANHRACQLFGYTRTELLSTKTSELEVKETQIQPADESHTTQDTTFETLAQHRDGDQIPIEVTRAPLIERENKLFLSIVRDITERKQAERSLQRHNAELTALNTVAQVLSTTLQLNKLLERVLDSLQQMIPYDVASISLLHTANIPRDGKSASRSPIVWPVASRGLQLPTLQGLALEKLPLVQQIVRERGPIIIPDTLREPQSVPLSQTLSLAGPDGLHEGQTSPAPVRSWLGVPLISKERVIGVALVGSHRPNAYEQDAARLAFTFSHQVALAIDNSRLYEQTRTHLRETILLHSVTAALSSTLDMSQMLPYMARSLCEAMNSTSVEIYEPDTEQGAITVIADYGILDSTQAESQQEPPSNLGQTHSLADFPAADNVLARSRPKQIQADDPEIDPRDRANLQAHDAQAMLLLPMVAHGHTMGMAAVWESQAPRHFTQGETATAQTLTHQAAIAMDHARLFAETQRRVSELQLLHNVGLAAASGVHLEDTMQASAQALATALPDTRVAVMLLDPQTNTLSVKASVGYPRDEIENLRLQLGEGISGWVAQHGEPVIVPDVRLDPRYYQADTDTRSELCVPLATGPFIIGALNVASPRPDDFTDDDLQLLSTLASSLAVLAERARLFTQVEETKIELEQRAEALEVANASLKELDKLKDQFLANMSHELRTPLNSIIGYADVLVHGMVGEISPEQMRCVRDIAASGNHLMSLINDILDLSKIEAGHMTLEPTTFPIQKLLEEVQTTISPLIEKKSQALLVEQTDGLPALAADRFRIKQILLNLLSNANKFTPHEGTITVSCHLADSTSIIFSVADNGIGINLEDQENIFEKFRQASNSSAQKTMGTGLGLNISRRLVEMHGGRIWVESEYGHGAIFSFALPHVASPD